MKFETLHTCAHIYICGLKLDAYTSHAGSLEGMHTKLHRYEEQLQQLQAHVADTACSHDEALRSERENAASLHEQLAVAQGAMAELQAQSQQQADELDSDGKSRAQLQTQVGELEGRVGTLQARLEDAAGDKASLLAQAAEGEAAAATSAQEHQTAMEELQARLRAAEVRSIYTKICMGTVSCYMTHVTLLVFHLP